MPNPTGTCRCGLTWTGLNTCHCCACHHSFSGPSLFDQHRTMAGPHGTCHDPETLHNRRTGKRLMFHRDGMWRGPEMDDVALARRTRISA